MLILWAKTTDISRSSFILWATCSTKCSLKCIGRHIILIVKSNLSYIILWIIIGALRVFWVIIIKFILIQTWIGLWIPKIIIPTFIPRLIVHIVFLSDLWLALVLIIIIGIGTSIITHLITFIKLIPKSPTSINYNTFVNNDTVISITRVILLNLQSTSTSDTPLLLILIWVHYDIVIFSVMTFQSCGSCSTILLLLL